MKQLVVSHRSKPICAAVVALAVATALPAAAQTFRAENRVDVVAVPGGFEAFEGGGQGGRGLWCAAADYAKRVLGARGTERLYVKTARGPSTTDASRISVGFTLDPSGLTPSATIFPASAIRTPGRNLSVDHAYIFCSDYRIRNSR